MEPTPVVPGCNIFKHAEPAFHAWVMNVDDVQIALMSSRSVLAVPVFEVPTIGQPFLELF